VSSGAAVSISAVPTDRRWVNCAVLAGVGKSLVGSTRRSRTVGRPVWVVTGSSSEESGLDQGQQDGRRVVRLIAEHQSTMRVRPDQKVVVARDWPTPEMRLKGVQAMLGQLVRLAERKAA